MTMPPPMPNSAANRPDTTPMPTYGATPVVRSWPVSSTGLSYPSVAGDPLAPFRDDPRTSAFLLDVDGTLAPIAAHPDRAAVPPATLAILARLVARCALVGLVSGRAAADVARLVPVAGVRIAGNHGLEFLDEDGDAWAPGVAAHLGDVAAVADALDPIVGAVGGWVERKGATLTAHYREATDPDAARAALERDGVPLCTAAGLAWRWGRMSLEARAPVDADKGTAIRELLRRHPAARSLFIGDDRTDLDGFRAVDLRVAVYSPEAPAELIAAADVVVEGTAGVADLLRDLVG